MHSLPALEGGKNIDHSPHVVILGAGASLAACPEGDATGRRIPLMKNIVEVVGLGPVLEDYGISPEVDDFERFFDELSTAGDKSDLVRVIETAVYEYFSGMRLPEEANIYDYLILSLRKTDLIATFNWDPFLAQAYQRNMNVANLPRIAFLHGNVEIGVCHEHQRIGFHLHTCDQCGVRLTPTRLLYPVRQKDYQADPYTESEWKTLRAYLRDAYFVTIFGYSAPVTDVEAKSLMLEVWRNNPTVDLAQIEIVDIRPRDEIEKNWSKFLVRQNYSIVCGVFKTYLFAHPRRSCDAFAMATLQQRPWEDNRWPRFAHLWQLHQWIQPLLSEEANEFFTGKPCPPL